MARRRNLRSISVPITLGAVTVVLSAGLLVAWSILLANNIATSENVSIDVWLLVLGAVSFLVIITVLVLFSIFLAREILEVRRQDSFIDSVTHELRSPLASLRLCLETRERPGLTPEQDARLHQMMKDDVDRLSSFIDDVLQASRLAHDKPAMNTEEFSLESLIQSIVESSLARYHLAPECITVSIEEPIVLHSDRAALEIVLRNLVDNAIKYSSNETEVHIRAYRKPKKQIRIEVKDSGIGIDPQQIHRVFDRFYRVKDETVRKRRGTGLGLFVVKALVRNLGGDIVARSDGPGKGTEMIIDLPGNGRLSTKAPRKKGAA